MAKDTTADQSAASTWTDSFTTDSNQRIAYYIRPMCIADASSIARIQNYYISNTIKSFQYTEFSVSTVEDRIRTALEEKYPAFVAVLGPDHQQSKSDSTDQLRTESRMLGYISTSRFRPRSGWSPSVEVSLFLEPEYERRGIGTALLTLLIEQLRDTKRQLDLADDVQDEDFVEIRDGKRYVRQLIAVCVVDEDDLEGFYTRRGFKKIAYFEDAGYKSGMWIDVVMLQLLL